MSLGGKDPFRQRGVRLGVRRGRIVIVRDIPVTATDTRVGDADVSRRSEGGVTTPL